jgi:hypothetical protein
MTSVTEFPCGRVERWFNFNSEITYCFLPRESAPDLRLNENFDEDGKSQTHKGGN